MPTTLIFGVITFLLVLGPLVILHELGHLLVARKFGVKVLEFGFGFPPRAGGFWTGRTEVYLAPDTRYDLPGGKPALAAGGETDLPAPGRAALAPGQVVTIRSVQAEDGTQHAVSVRRHDREDDQEASHGGSLVVGKIREIDGDRVVIADMLWSFNWLPIGGFVRMVGEEDPNAKGSLASKSRFARISVMGAGAAVNVIIPFIIFPAILMIPQDVQVGDVVISAVMPGSPADEAGIEQGDRILRVDGRDIENVGDLQESITLRLGAASTWEIERGVADPFPQPGGPAYQYTGDTETVTVTPRWRPPRREVVEEVADPATQISLSDARVHDAGVGLNDRLRVVENVSDTLTEISLADARSIDPSFEAGDVLRVVPVRGEGQDEISLEAARQYNQALGLYTFLQEGAVGVRIGTQNIETVSRALPPWEAIPTGIRSTVDVILLTRNAFTGAIIGSQNPQFEGPATVGPVGIGQLTGEVATTDAPLAAKITTLASLAAVLSFSLAILNILPIPALDGGRILFVVIEIVRGGKRISPEREGLVHLVGFVILLSLVALISVQDIMRIFRGDSFF
ncbi:MAG: site-2 protease family protein [Dehalococcoidia bacterium]